MKLPSLPLVVLDTETTGFVPRVHKVIEFASAVSRDGKLEKEYDQLFHHAEIPPMIETLTRIRTADVKGKPSIEEKRAEILAHLPEDALIVGQNVLFDIGMLKGEGIDLSERPFIDTSMLASLLFPECASYSLGYLSATLKLNHDPPHRALGDVRATMQLLSKCWERLLELPKDLRDLAEGIMQRAPAGYKMLFAALPPPTAKKDPAWLQVRSRLGEGRNDDRTVALHKGTAGKPTLLEEALDPGHTAMLIRGALEDSSVRHWIAVKNLRPTLRRIPEDLVQKVRVIYPPQALIDVDAVTRFSAQAEYTADEATLALKLAWYEPTRRDELPLHGGEESVWNGKLRCTVNSEAYVKQFHNLPAVVLLDHRELLEFLQTPDHAAAEHFTGKLAHVIVDDASMLEDTSTKAYGWYCAMDDMRAAGNGDPLLTKFVDTLQLWVEKTRQFQDIRYLTTPDLTAMEAKGLRSLLAEVEEKPWPEQVARQFADLARILTPENINHRIAWIEQKPNGNQSLHSVPERIGELLSDSLFKRFPTTLVIPRGCVAALPEILPPGTVLSSAVVESVALLPIAFDPHPTLDELLTSPPEGKTVILLPGKSVIEDLYVKHVEALEKKGITMICQGLNGGMGRMQADFLAAEGAALWLLTPWMFEGVDLPEGSVHRLVIKSLPFDHPNHTVLSRRSQHYRDPFSEYSLPRLLHRMFRLLRVFAEIRTPDGEARLLDDRVSTKEYGKRIRAYLEQLTGSGVLPTAAPAPATVKPTTKPAPAKEPKAKASPSKKGTKGQLSLF